MTESKPGRRIELRFMEIEADPMKVWQDVFTNVHKFASEKGEPVTSFAPFFKMPVLLTEDAQEADEYMVRINPAASDENGKPKIIVLDGQFNGRHVQQIVLEAEWSEDVPEVKTADKSKIPEADFLLPYEILGMITNEYLKFKLQKDEKTSDNVDEEFRLDPDTALRLSNSYSRGVN